jgi:hypothetical protein
VSDEIVMVHPDLPEVEHITSRRQFEDVWQALGWKIKSAEGGPRRVPRSIPQDAGTEEA